MNADRISTEMFNKMKAAFKTYDTNSSGKIDHLELQNAFNCLGQEMSIDSIARTLEEVDIDHDGEISFREFTIMVSSQLSNSPPEEKRSAYAQAFSILGGNQDTTGLVEKQKMIDIIEKYGLTLDISNCGDELTYGDFETLLYQQG